MTLEWLAIEVSYRPATSCAFCFSHLDTSNADPSDYDPMAVMVSLDSRELADHAEDPDFVTVC